MKKEETLDLNIPKKFGIVDCVSYAMADFGCNMSFSLKNTLAIFWTQYMGLELWYSLLLVIVNVWDAINDPLIGTIIDSDKHNPIWFYRFNIFGSDLLYTRTKCFHMDKNTHFYFGIYHLGCFLHDNKRPVRSSAFSHIKGNSG